MNLSVVTGNHERAKILQQVRRRLHLGLSSIEAIVASHDLLCSPEFQASLEGFEAERLLVADEAHNLGRPTFVSNPPQFFEHRLALSATPIRQYDDEGTNALFAFFGPVVYRFTLQEAIGRCLVEYDYYVHTVPLTSSEIDRWYELTEKIREVAWRIGDGAPDEYLAKLFRDRRLVLETASGKLDALAALLKAEPRRDLRHTLIYASDKEPGQLDSVNRLLKEMGILFHQLTAEETADRALTRRVIRSFQEGEVQVLTAKRVLDEGVNIPQICKAFILASTTVERQWIQRRGRLLRLCPSVGKTHGVVRDLLVVPPDMDKGNLDADARNLIRSELQRAQEFARLARNAGMPGGALEQLRPVIQAAFL